MQWAPPLPMNSSPYDLTDPFDFRFSNSVIWAFSRFSSRPVRANSRVGLPILQVAVPVLRLDQRFHLFSKKPKEGVLVNRVQAIVEAAHPDRLDDLVLRQREPLGQTSSRHASGAFPPRIAAARPGSAEPRPAPAHSGPRGTG